MSNIAWLFFDKAILIVSGLLVGAWVARYLGPEQYGTLNYASAFVALAMPLAQLGLRDIVIRNLVHNLALRNEILGTATMLQFAAGGFAIFAVIFIAGLTNADEPLIRALITVISLKILFLPARNFVEYWFHAQVQAKYFVWSHNITLLLGALIKITLIFKQAPLIVFAWTFVLESLLLSLILLFFYYKQKGSLIDLRFRFRQCSLLLKDSWPLILSAFAIVVYMKIDQVMLGQMVSNTELGYYSVAVRLSELWYFIPTAIASSAFPALIQIRNSGNLKIYRLRVQTFFDVMIGASYLIVISVVLLAEPLVTILFGPAYTMSGQILRVHAWAFIFVSIGVARNSILVVENIIIFQLFTTVLGAIVNVSLNYWLIPSYSGLGAAWATVISYAVASYFSCIFLTQLWPILGQLTLSLLFPFRFLFSLCRISI